MSIYKNDKPPYRRSIQQRLEDEKFIFDSWKVGNTLDNITERLIEYNKTEKGISDYYISRVTVFKTLKTCINNAKKERERLGPDRINQLVIKLDDIYREARREMDRPQARGAINDIAKLEGLLIDRQESNVTLNFDIDIE